MPEEKEIVQGLLDFLYTMEYPFVNDECYWRRGEDIDKDITMYMLGNKYLIPDLRDEAGRAFRDKVDYICEAFPTLDEICMNMFYNAIKMVYNELPDDDWPRWYLIQHIFQSRANFLSDDRFKDFLKDHETLNDDFIEEVAFDSKMEEWRKHCREQSQKRKGSKRGSSTYFTCNRAGQFYQKLGLRPTVVFKSPQANL